MQQLSELVLIQRGLLGVVAVTLIMHVDRSVLGGLLCMFAISALRVLARCHCQNTPAARPRIAMDSAAFFRFRMMSLYFDSALRRNSRVRVTSRRHARNRFFY